jgi:HKD family nuclease
MSHTATSPDKLENSIIAQPGDTAAAAIVRLAKYLPYSRIRVAAAYATELGALKLSALLSETPQWMSSGKRFLISFDNGITQPEALVKLAGLPQSEVRIPRASEALKSTNLRANPSFHAKCYCFDVKNASKLAIGGLLIGSNNLTGAGLELNFELAALMNASTLQLKTHKDFNEWWNNAWSKAEPLTDSLLGAYRKRRLKVAADSVANPPDGELSPTELANASSLWIKGSLMGGSDNQLELPQGVAQFFGFSSGMRTIGESIDLQLIWNKQNRGGWLKFWRNGVWRLRLPTIREGGPSFRGTVIRLDRTDSANSYIVRTAPEGSDAADKWASKSRHLGSIQFTMKNGKGRQYGWF